MFKQPIINRFFSLLEHIKYGEITITTPDRHTRTFKGQHRGAKAQLHIHRWQMIGSMIKRGTIALAEAYRDGWWDSEDKTALFLFGLQNEAALDSYINGNTLGRIASKIAYLFNRNTLRGSKKNIHAHYDVGNDFYALWLDPTMTYSSAIFNHENETLENAQTRKYDRIIERLNPRGSLLEIGCGWGGFASRALEKGNYNIKGLTISNAQHEFASRRLGNQVDIALEDYRDQKGLYDQIVSIEMFEAVGERFWPVYFSKIKSLLAKKGKAVVQTITIADDEFEAYRRSGDPIRSFIFPGGMLPSTSRFREECAKVGLRVTDEFAFGKHYAITLTYWLKNFEAKIKEIKAMGFNEEFIRMWQFYLAFCIAAFKHGRTNVIQCALEHVI